MNTDKELEDLTARDLARAVYDYALAHLFEQRTPYGLPLANINGDTYAIAEDEDTLEEAIIYHLRHNHANIDEPAWEYIEDAAEIPADLLAFLACLPPTSYGMDIFRNALEITSSAEDVAAALITNGTAADFFGQTQQFITNEGATLILIDAA